MSMTRRGFLKAMAAATACAAMQVHAFSELSRATGVTVRPVDGGMILNDIMIYDKQHVFNERFNAFHYRVAAYRVGDSDRRKYFSVMVDDPDKTVDREFLHALYTRLDIAFLGFAA